MALLVVLLLLPALARGALEARGSLAPGPPHGNIMIKVDPPTASTAASRHVAGAGAGAGASDPPVLAEQMRAFAGGATTPTAADAVASRSLRDRFSMPRSALAAPSARDERAARRADSGPSDDPQGCVGGAGALAPSPPWLSRGLSVL